MKNNEYFKYEGFECENVKKTITIYSSQKYVKKFPSKKMPWYLKLPYLIYGFFYKWQCGYSIEVGKEIERIDKAMEKVKIRINSYTKNYKDDQKFSDKLLKLYSTHLNLKHYKNEISGYYTKTNHPTFYITGESKMVDEILDYKW